MKGTFVCERAFYESVCATDMSNVWNDVHNIEILSLIVLYTTEKTTIDSWGIASSDGIPNGLADFFFFFFFSSSYFFRRRIWHSRRPNTMKETLH